MSTDRRLKIVEESLSAEDRLAVYEKVADDESAERELRMLLARKANWLRVTARLRSTGKIVSGLQQVEIRDRERAHAVDGEEAEAILFSPIRIAGNLRERANEACKKIINEHKRPVGIMGSLKERIGQRKTRTKRA